MEGILSQLQAHVERVVNDDPEKTEESVESAEDETQPQAAGPASVYSKVEEAAGSPDDVQPRVGRVAVHQGCQQVRHCLTQAVVEVEYQRPQSLGEQADHHEPDVSRLR